MPEEELAEEKEIEETEEEVEELEEEEGGLQSGEDFVVADLLHRWYNKNDWNAFKRLCEIAKQLNGSGKWEKYFEFAKLLRERNVLTRQLEEVRFGKRFGYIAEIQKMEQRVETVEEQLTEMTFTLSENFTVFKKTRATGKILEQLIRKAKPDIFAMVEE